MANEIQVLPQADPSLLNVLNLAHQTHRALQNWQAQHPNDVFFRSHWDDIDNLDTGIVDIKCKIADLIAYSLVDHLQYNVYLCRKRRIMFADEFKHEVERLPQKQGRGAAGEPVSDSVCELWPAFRKAL